MMKFHIINIDNCRRKEIYKEQYYMQNGTVSGKQCIVALQVIRVSRLKEKAGGYRCERMS